MLSLFGGWRPPLFGVKKKVSTPAGKLSNDQKDLYKRAVAYAEQCPDVLEFGDHGELVDPKWEHQRWFALHLMLFKEKEDARKAEVKVESAAGGS